MGGGCFGLRRRCRGGHRQDSVGGGGVASQRRGFTRCGVGGAGDRTGLSWRDILGFKRCGGGGGYSTGLSLAEDFWFHAMWGGKGGKQDWMDCLGEFFWGLNDVGWDEGGYRTLPCGGFLVLHDVGWEGG